jgi:hypothetical protein
VTIICIGGTTSHCGKTAMACLLLRAFPGWAAIKVTPCRPDEACPRGDDCSACRAPDERFEIITDQARLGLAGKDTARFLDAGAERVVWVRALLENLPEALESALVEVAGEPGVIVESTTAMQFLGGLHVMVTRTNQPDVKESARSAPPADIVAVNMTPAEIGNTLLDRDQADGHTFPVCAVLPPEHSVNRSFVEECFLRVRNLRNGSSLHAA